MCRRSRALGKAASAGPVVLPGNAEPREIVRLHSKLRRLEAEVQQTSAVGLGALLDCDAQDAPTGVFRHKVSKLFHVIRPTHPDSDGEATAFVCGRLANGNYERLDKVLPAYVSKCSGCWCSR